MKSGLDSFDCFHGQFFITDQNYAAPPSWREHRLNAWRIVHHPSLPVLECVRHDGMPVGFLIGWAISDEGSLLAAGVEQAEPLVVPEGDETCIERFIYSHGGRYCVLIDVPGCRRLYLDPYGSLAVVYTKNNNIAGSTPTLIERITTGHVDRTEQDCPPKHLYFPAGLTISDEISRLVANHFLDLDRWVAKRHWPSGSFDWTSNAGDCEDLADRIASRLKRNIRAVTEHTSAYIGLTAGRDSRVQLACCRDLTDRVVFYTTYEDENSITSRRDLHAARRIARDNSLQCIEVPYHEFKKQLSGYEKKRYLEAIGYSGNWGFQHFHRACIEYLDLSNVLLMGFGGEVIRAYFWKASDSMTRTWSPAELLARLSLPKNERFSESVEAWLDNLVEFDPVLVLELFYLENRVSSWACPHLYGCAPFRFTMIPYTHREIVESAYKLPVEYRKALGVERFIMQKYWPRLAKYPFQSFIGMERAVHGLKRRLRRLRVQM